MKFTQVIYIVGLIVLLTGKTTLAEDASEDEVILRVVPPNIAVQPGEEIVLECMHYPENLTADLNLDWYTPSGDGPLSKILENQSENSNSKNGTDYKRFQSVNGTLTITNATLGDAGMYKCVNPDSSLEVEAMVKVFIMPSYTTEVIIVLVINGILLLIFIMCSIWTFFKDRKQRNQHKRKHKLGHHEIAKRALED